jgi:hypothetical protein
MSNKNDEKLNGGHKNDEKMTLDDAARVKVLSPSRLVFKRFIRNKLAIFGMCILVAMFVFCFVGPLFYPYGETDIFYGWREQNGDYAYSKIRTEFESYWNPEHGQEFQNGFKSVTRNVNSTIKKMNEDYRIGARNQIAASEEQRCVSLIAQAIRREWDKESFKWYPGLQPLAVELNLGPGGTVRGFRILRGSGDADVDRTAQSALRRLTRISGLSASFLEKFSTLSLQMEPVQGN